MIATETTTEALTMLEALATYSEEEVVERLTDGRLQLAGNFRGHELEVVQSWVEAQ
jgi:hypothetical protein